MIMILDFFANIDYFSISCKSFVTIFCVKQKLPTFKKAFKHIYDCTPCLSISKYVPLNRDSGGIGKRILTHRQGDGKGRKLLLSRLTNI